MTTALRVATVVFALITLVLAVLVFTADADVTWALVSMALMLACLTLWQQQKRKGEGGTPLPH